MKAEIRSMALAAVTSVVALVYAHVATAQVDLSGTWSVRTDQDNEIRGAGPDPVAYMGVPLSKEGLAASLAYTPEDVNEIDRQCEPWQVHYILMGPFGFRIGPTMNDAGDVVAWNITGSIDKEPTTIWVDGQHKAPSAQALHTPVGFTTGHWQGDTLVTTTTGISDGFLVRNGVPSSEHEVFTMYITRHENLLTITGVVQDPVYLTAPYVMSGVWVFDPNAPVADPRNMLAACTPEEELQDVGPANVPTYLTPKDNTSLMFETQRYNIPHEAALGGAETMYPEYTKKLNAYKPPSRYCDYQCCGSQGPGGLNSLQFDTQVLHCTIGQ